MKATLLLLISGSLAWSAAAADLFIESLNRDGRLTWTNSVSNATYRVEWSGSLSGPWNDFNTLTNLNSLAATNTRVSVRVPMFYRVVWTDPPAPQPSGRWLFSGYDSSDMLVATGLVIIASVNTATNPALGSWTLGSFDGTNNS
ncbi:MAG TPA: hypothetical protein VHI52_10130, partial [Verrucomicrobiae bacterium]|nr:hypothetical protein [Verrucomicrobiae bacterium]